MKTIQVVLNNETGLHARPAAQFVQNAAKFKSKVEINDGKRTADGKSILAVMAIGLGKGSVFIIKADGEDEEACLNTLQQLVENNFGER